MFFYELPQVLQAIGAILAFNDLLHGNSNAFPDLRIENSNLAPRDSLVSSLTKYMKQKSEEVDKYRKDLWIFIRLSELNLQELGSNHSKFQGLNSQGLKAIFTPQEG